MDINNIHVSIYMYRVS